LPALFTDEGYLTLGQNILSTSTLVNEAIMGGGFGPVHPQGYGIGYAVEKDTIGLEFSKSRQ
jgi:hypothetical protein